MSRIVLHAGLHKTGTTTVQQLARRGHALLAERGVFVPPPTEDARYGSRAGGLHAVARELREGAGLPVLDELLARFEASGLGTMLLSSEGLGPLRPEALARLADRLSTHEVDAVLVFRHPIAQRGSHYRGRGFLPPSDPVPFLERAGRGGGPLDVAEAWRAAFPARRLMRYEDHEDAAAAILDGLGAGPVADALRGAVGGGRRRASVRPETALLARRLRVLMRDLPDGVFRVRVYNNLLAFEETGAFRDVVERFGPADAVFPLDAQERFLAARAEALAALEAVLGPPARPGPGHREPIPGTCPDPDCVDALAARFLMRHLPRTEGTYVD